MLTLQPGVFRPLEVVMWLVDYRLWGTNPVGYHLVNILSHALTSCLLFAVALMLFQQVVGVTEARRAALLSSLLFLLHPSHTESVSWIADRQDILATLLMLCSWYGYVRFRQKGGAARLALSVLAYLAALLFKESPLAFPVLLAAHELWLVLRDSNEWNWRRVGVLRFIPAYVGVVAAYAALRWLALGKLVGGYELAYVRLSWGVILNLAATVARSFLPYAPVQLLPHQPQLGLTNASVLVLGLAAIVGGVLLAGAALIRRSKVHMFACFLILALVVSAMPTIAARPSIIDSEGERFTYLPSVFACMILGLVLTQLAAPLVLRIAVSGVLLVTFAVFLEISNQSWRAAGDISRTILSAVEAQPGDAPLDVLALPDNLNGAFIYRNGLQDALLIFSPQRQPPVNIVGFTFLRESNEVVSITPEGPGRYVVDMPEARGTLHSADGDSNLVLAPGGLYRFDVQVRGDAKAAYYSDGAMHFIELTTSGMRS